MEVCKKNCRILPADFEENIEKLFADLFTNSQSVDEDIARIVDEIKKII